MAMEDVQGIFEGYAQDAEVTRYLTWRPHASIEETESHVRAHLKSANSHTYMLTQQETGEIIGAFDLRQTSQARMEYGYVLARAFWGRGLMTEALTEVVDWALRQPSIWRIGGVADVDNAASARVMEKAGLECERVLRRWIVHPNAGKTPRDCFSFAKTR